MNPLPPEQEDEALPESAVATARTIVLEGAGGHLIDVQVDLSHGLVKTALVGRPDASITEARDRCRSALTNSGFAWPSTRRVTILLSPADLPKRGSHFDLAIAMAMLRVVPAPSRRAARPPGRRGEPGPMGTTFPPPRVSRNIAR